MRATGIHIDGPFLRLAHVKKTGGQITVTQLSAEEAANSTVKPLDSASLVSGLSSEDVLIRSYSLSPSKNKHIRQAIILQTETELQLNPEEIITVSVLDEPGKIATTLSTTKTAIQKHLNTFSAFQLDPERVSAVPSALQSFVRWKAPEISSYFLIDVGLQTTNCIWIENNAIKKAHAIRFNLQQLSKSILGCVLSEINFSIVKTNQYPAFSDEARNYRREISKVLHSFACQRPIIFTGERWSGFHEFLLETLHDCITEEKKLNLSSEEPRFAISIGLAIDYLSNRSQPIQFRRNDLVSGQSWKKLGQLGVSILGLSALLALLFFWNGDRWIRQREEEIVQSLEIWTATKDPALRKELFIAGASTSDLVQQWIHLVNKSSKDYRFIMKAPKAAQFLDWLTHHPLIQSFQSTPHPIVFEQIRYQLVSFPHLDAMDDPYLVKVDLDFKTTSPLHARKFHEELLQKSEWIDSSQEISWDLVGDHYQSSFYLKNI